MRVVREATASSLRSGPGFFCRCIAFWAVLLAWPLAGWAEPPLDIASVRIGLSPGKTRVVFDASSPVSYRLTYLDNPARLVIALENARSHFDVRQLPLAGTPISSMESDPAPNGDLSYTFFIEPETRADAFILKPYLDRGDRLVLDLYAADPAETAVTPGADSAPPPAIAAPGPQPAPANRGPTRAPARAASSYTGEWSGYVSLDSRLYFHSPTYPEQDDQNASVALQPEYHADWAGGAQRLAFIPFYRLDANDSKRTHADIRELYWQIDSASVSFKAGIDVVFWGVAESQHLVDIINQTDLVEDLDGEEKLGQPMLNLDYMGELGTWQVYVMPYFRDRTFPGRHGRLRNDPPVDTGGALYESGDKQDHLDFALRWSRSIGDWDLGLAHFSGTSREAALLPSSRGGQPALVPFYPQIDQSSLDLQATLGAWLWKLEAIYNQNNYDNYYAAVAGFEYTDFGVAGSATDLGWLLEYHHDQRGEASGDELIPTSLQNDLYLGMRWTANDLAGTRVLAGVIGDLDTGSMFGNLEYSRRLGELWTLGVEARILWNIDNQDLFYPIKRDDYIGIEFTRHY